MNLLFRLAFLILRGLRYPGISDPLAEARLGFRVLPTDLDFNLHMNNARYLAIMDLGRLDLLNRMGLLRLAFRGRWFPVLGAATIRYTRPLKFWQHFELVTRLVGWDEKWFFLEQRFECEGKLMATALVKGLLRGPDGSVSSREVLRVIGVERESPELGEAVERLGLE